MHLNNAWLFLHKYIYMYARGSPTKLHALYGVRTPDCR